jgi:hypothetical protein
MHMKYCIIGVTLLALGGCASHGVMVAPEKVATLKRGVSTEADAVATLGQPTSITNYNGVRVLVYSGAQAQARPASFIPFIGPFVGGADSQASVVMLHFGTNGILTDVVSSQSRTGSGTGFAAGAPIQQTPDTPRKVE